MRGQNTDQSRNAALRMTSREEAKLYISFGYQPAINCSNVLIYA